MQNVLNIMTGLKLLQKWVKKQGAVVILNTKLISFNQKFKCRYVGNVQVKPMHILQVLSLWLVLVMFVK